MTLKSEQRLTFQLLVVYRWLSLLPPLIWLFFSPPPAERAGGGPALFLAVGLTLLLTLGAAPANRLLLRRPWLLGIDLLVSTGLIWNTGGEDSPFYLYSLAPILAAAFFFSIRGGLLAAAAYTFCYAAALASRSLASPLDLPGIASQLISFFLIGAIFGYLALLLRRLHAAHRKLAAQHGQLSQRNRDLNLIRELSLVMQSSLDPAELQESILHGLVHELGYRRAAIALYDETAGTLTSWLTLAEPADRGSAAQMAHTDVIPLAREPGLLSRALRENQVVEITDGRGPTSSPVFNERLRLGQHYLVLPLSLREHPIGVILIDQLPPDQQLSAADRLSLDDLVRHAGVALGSTRLCIDRAQRTAITEERNRIAAELHDNVSQILYGLAYSLEACVQLLPHESDVQPVLTRLHAMVAEAQARVRKVIFGMWSSEVSAETFVAGLHRRLSTVCPGGATALRIDLPATFNEWDAATRNHLYQVAREAVGNAAKHANANQIRVTLSSGGAFIELQVADNGQGFNPAEVDSSGHLGMHNMVERLNSLQGTLTIQSQAGRGTTIIARVPSGAFSGV